MLKNKFYKFFLIFIFILLLTMTALCLVTGCGKKDDKSAGEDKPPVSEPVEDPSGTDEPPEEHVNVPVERTELNLKTISIKAGETFYLSDYPVKLPITDCNFFLAEMLIDAWPCNLTIKITDTEDEDNYFILKARISKRSAEREGEEIDGPDGMIEYSYQIADGEESEEMATLLSYWEDMASGGTTQDVFSGYIWQLQYDGGSGRIGCFNVGSSFISTDGFEAETVTMSITSDIDVRIGLRYFGDTMNWDKTSSGGDTDSFEESHLEKKTVYLKSGETFALTDYPIALPVNDSTFFLAEMIVSNPANVTMKVTDTEDEDNYFELLMDVQAGSLSYSYRIADGLRSLNRSAALAFWSDMDSTGILKDTFTGWIIQWEYQPESGKIGCFNQPDTFTGLDGFEAETVYVSFTSDSDVKIGLRYLGDTKDWRISEEEQTEDPAGESTLEVKTVKLIANSTYTLTDYPVTLPASDCNFFLAEMYVSNDANIVMRVADKDNADNYFELNLKLEGNNLTMSYKKAGGEASKECTTVLASAENVGSGGSVADVFTGKTIQLVFNGSSRNIGVFNVPDTFIGLDGFEASGVVVSFTSDAAVNIGLRYFGDTLDWKFSE